MTFHELPLGSLFEFDHSGMQSCSGVCHGPWQKLSPRCYVPCCKATRERWGRHRARVGSRNIRVVPLTIDQLTDYGRHCGTKEGTGA